MKELCILILLFYSYSFLGWLMEVCVSIVERHRLVNRGFLIGPICPIYGFGGVLVLLLLNKYAKDPLIFFLMSIIICSILEYFTSYIMEKIFKNRWWDYSNKKFNINGRICLECAIPFGIIAVVVFYGLNPLLISLFNKLPVMAIKITALSLLGLTFIDLIFSFNVILTLKNISNNIKCDSTEAITKKVREILNSKTILHRRLVDSFPKMQVKNRMAILKERISKDKEELKLEKEKLGKKKRGK